MFIINFCLNMFRESLCPSSGEQRPCYCVWCTALVLLDVVGSGCGALRLFSITHSSKVPFRTSETYSRNLRYCISSTSLMCSQCETYKQCTTLRDRHTTTVIVEATSRNTSHNDSYCYGTRREYTQIIASEISSR